MAFTRRAKESLPGNCASRDKHVFQNFIVADLFAAGYGVITLYSNVQLCPGLDNVNVVCEAVK